MWRTKVGQTLIGLSVYWIGDPHLGMYSLWQVERFLGQEDYSEEKVYAEGGASKVDITGLLKCYKVREFVVRRWVPNRTRD